MIATHRSGEPENAVGPYVASTSLLGIPNEKALVTEDFIIEIAGYRKMNKSNELYDSLHLPRYINKVLNYIHVVFHNIFK